MNIFSFSADKVPALHSILKADSSRLESRSPYKILIVFVISFTLAMLTPTIGVFAQEEVPCTNTTERIVDPWYYFDHNKTSAYPKGAFWPLNAISTCYNTLGDGMRIHAFPSFDLFPSIRFSFDTYQTEGLGECSNERAARVGIVPPFTGAGNLVTTGMYPISLNGYQWGDPDTCPWTMNNFQVGDAFLVATCNANDLILSTNNPNGRIKFFTSPPAVGERNQLERMTILGNGNVGIGTYNPIGKLDINVGQNNYNLPKISFTSGATTLDSYTNPQIRLYSPSGDPNCDEGRSTSYSWYIQTIRQYEPTIWHNVLDDADAGTGNNTTQGGLHFMAGYDPTDQINHLNPMLHSPSGDIYSDIIGHETPVARMSLLSGGNVGINNTVPMTKFQVTDGAVLFDGVKGATPLERKLNTTSGHYEAVEIGDGTRLMWIPSKAAFRAGRLESSTMTRVNGILSNEFWNSNHIGDYSVAAGRDNLVEGESATAFGYDNAIVNFTVGETLTPSLACFAAGLSNTICGQTSTALGKNNDVFVQTSYPLEPVDNAVAIGTFNEISWSDGICIGLQNHILTTFGVTPPASGGVGIGYQNKINGHGIAIGERNYAQDSKGCISIGTDAKSGLSLGNDYSCAIGYRVNALADRSFVIGAGRQTFPSLTMENNTAKSLIVGFESDTPTLFVSGGNGTTGSYGKVGIGTITPADELQVIGAARISGKVGVGMTGTTSCTLGVDGTACIGYSGAQAVPVPSSGGSASQDVSLIVENTVIINNSGGSPAYVNSSGSYGTSNGGSYLQVWGEAIKYTSGSAWDIPSDARYKKDVHPFEDGLTLLKKVQPVRFMYDEKLGIKGTEEGIGVLAQDIQKIFPYTVHEHELLKSVRTKEEKRYQVDDMDTIFTQVLDLSLPKDSTGHYPTKDTILFKPTKRWLTEPAEFRIDSMPLLTYNSSAITYVLINSVKELDSLRLKDKHELIEKVQTQNLIIESQNFRLDSLALANKYLEDRISRLETKIQIPLDEASDIILEQNNPNPFSESSTITYFIPDKVQGDVELIITPIGNQTTILQRQVCVKGIPTQHLISARDMNTGVYVYSLVGSGKVVASKKLIIIK